MDVTTIQITNFLSRYSSRKFQWGVFDCADFFSDCLELITGFDYSPIFKGQWSNKRQALRFFSRLDFIQFIDTEMDFTEQTINSCKTGDLCVFTCGKMHTVGMVYDTRVACVVEGLGLTYADLSEIKRDIVKILRVHNG